jgi:2-polyprenyl-3-methyl-5-hydroxy-6-metoxy-1,4-benzoquinol methylase
MNKPATIARVAERYSRTGARVFVRAKLRTDPVGDQVVKVAQRMAANGRTHGCGDVVDVGCGRGQMGFVLTEHGLAASVLGFDRDAEKIAEATFAAKGDARFQFLVGDTRTLAIPACDTVLMIDVLHYLTDEQQSSLVLRAARSARGAIVIRELDPDRGWRSAMTRVQEEITTRFGYLRTRPITPVVECLRDNGFDVSVEPSWGRTPFSNVLVVGMKT